MKVVFLSNKIPWFGSHTGYQQLPNYVAQLNGNSPVIASSPGLAQRIVGKLYSTWRRWPARNQSDAAAEFRFMLAGCRNGCVRHILHLEDHLQFLDAWAKAPVNLIGTIHLPPARWAEADLQYLRRLSSAIILYQRDVQFFEQHVGEGRVRFIHHGVDTEFFRPVADFTTVEANKILFSGHYLRNTRMLQRVISGLSSKQPQLHFHLLVPERFRSLEGFGELKGSPNITWHQNLTDEALRDLIQSSYIVLLPMNDSGANTAVVEAMSCGTPVVTTDVGGIRDYSGGEILPLVRNDDDQAMMALIERYLANPEWRNERSARCRVFAEQNLAWPVIADKHLAIFEELAR